MKGEEAGMDAIEARGVVNQWIGKYLKGLLGTGIIRVVPPTRGNSLSEYTRN